MYSFYERPVLLHKIYVNYLIPRTDSIPCFYVEYYLWRTAAARLNEMHFIKSMRLRD